MQKRYYYIEKTIVKLASSPASMMRREIASTFGSLSRLSDTKAIHTSVPSSLVFTDMPQRKWPNHRLS